MFHDDVCSTQRRPLVALTPLRFMAYAHESAIKDSSQMASDPGTASLERELMRLLEEEQ